MDRLSKITAPALVMAGGGDFPPEHQRELVAGFVAAHRAAALTAVMKTVSAVGGPTGMVVLALAAGLLLGVVWRWWAPAVVLA